MASFKTVVAKFAIDMFTLAECRPEPASYITTCTTLTSIWEVSSGAVHFRQVLFPAGIPCSSFHFSTRYGVPPDLLNSPSLELSSITHNIQILGYGIFVHSTSVIHAEKDSTEAAETEN